MFCSGARLILYTRPPHSVSQQVHPATCGLDLQNASACNTKIVKLPFWYCATALSPPLRGGTFPHRPGFAIDIETLVQGLPHLPRTRLSELHANLHPNFILASRPSPLHSPPTASHCPPRCAFCIGPLRHLDAFATRRYATFSTALGNRCGTVVV